MFGGGCYPERGRHTSPRMASANPSQRKKPASELPKTYDAFIQALNYIRESIDKRTHSGNKYPTKFEDMVSLKSGVNKQLEVINGLFHNIIEMHMEVKEAHDKKEQAI